MIDVSEDVEKVLKETLGIADEEEIETHLCLRCFTDNCYNIKTMNHFAFKDRDWWIYDSDETTILDKISNTNLEGPSSCFVCKITVSIRKYRVLKSQWVRLEQLAMD